MVDKREALDILQKEYDYEDSIMTELSNTYLAVLKNIKDLIPEELKELNKKLTIIRDESEGHREIFEKLINFVKNGTDNY